MDLSIYFEHLILKTAVGTRKIFCIIRKKWIVATPEEMVRQVCLHYLIDQGFSKNHISVEKQFRVNNMVKRYDILISTRNSDIHAVVECKAPEVSLHQKHVDQIGIYNIALKSPYLWISNGHESLTYFIDHSSETFTKISAIPLP